MKKMSLMLLKKAIFLNVKFQREIKIEDKNNIKYETTPGTIFKKEF